jgi:integrase
LRKCLDNRIYGTNDLFFKQYADQWLIEKKMKPDTAKGYRNMIVKVDKIWPKLRFDQVDKKFVDRIMSAMCDNKQNYRHTILKKFKEVMQSAFIDNIHSNRYHQSSKFVPSTEKIDSVYLNMDQINQIYDHLDTMTPTHRNTAIVFLIGCLSGQRFQTYSLLNKGMIFHKDNMTFISIVTQKTSERVTIPVSTKLDHLLNMDYKIYSLQKVNQYIKEICSDLGFPEPEKVSTHTARRSFATNAVIQGIDISLIMKITGHKTEKEFRKYVRMDDLLAAQKSFNMIKIMQDQ